MLRTLPALLFGLFLVGPATDRAVAADPPADLVLLNGRVLSCDDSNQTFEAVAVRGARITAVGTTDSLKPLIGPSTKVVDLAGRALLPGFIECHGHLLMLGQQRIDVDLAGCATWEECVAKVAERKQSVRKGDWIVGRGWHQEHWNQPAQADGNRYPTHALLNIAVPRIPSS